MECDDGMSCDAMQCVMADDLVEDEGEELAHGEHVRLRAAHRRADRLEVDEELREQQRRRVEQPDEHVRRELAPQRRPERLLLRVRERHAELGELLRDERRQGLPRRLGERRERAVVAALAD